MPFYDRHLETLDRNALREWQVYRLRRLFKELRTNRFYQEKLGVAGVEGQFTGLEDLYKLPFTTKRELTGEQQASPSFGRLLPYPLERYRYLHQTSGTSGVPIKWLDTADDWKTWTRCWGFV